MFPKCYSFSLIDKVCEFAMEYMANAAERERGETLEAADGDVVARKTFGEAVWILVGAPAVSDSEVVFFSDDESDEDDWEEDDVLLEEGPEVIDPPATNNGVEGCGEQVGRRAVDMSRDEDEYVDIEGMSDSEEHDYDGEVVD
ncbi:uncharacterized protein LOC124662385 [Lolium rigidum]|uniref:uncharacterized protein LOC124662385 n=1 Tax=Lolium rigidum TaxID=89674 RepID=UPI001F5C3B02|nr:uncharacterized protein LOC124662385 [Lolium rigidum]